MKSVITQRVEKAVTAWRAGPVPKASAFALLAWALLTVSHGIALAREPQIQSAAVGSRIELRSTDLSRAGSGWVYRFPVSVSALSPVLGIEINGMSVNVPYLSMVRVEKALWLKAGSNEVRVRAFTDTDAFERTFTVHVEPLEPLDALPETRLADQAILIFRPLDSAPDLMEPDALLEVPGGPAWFHDPRLARPFRGGVMFEFEVEVSAFTPIREVRIEGRVVQRPHRAWTRVSVPMFAQPGQATVVVEAVTDQSSARKEFPLRLAAKRVPGTRLFTAAPPVAPEQAGPDAQGETGVRAEGPAPSQR